MRKPGPRVRLWLPIALTLAVATEASAQGLAVDLSAGRVVYQGVSAIYEPVSANLETNNLIGTLRYDAPSGTWVYGAAGVPVHSDLTWGGAGAGGRIRPRGSDARAVNVGLDVGGHAYLFRDGVVEATGRGASFDALPFVSVASDAASLEVRGGWRGHTLLASGVTERRGVFETGARAGYGSSVRVEADARWVRSDGATYPFVGGSLSYGGPSVRIWGQAGKWLSTVLDDVSWGAGVGVALASQVTLWAAARQDAPDPLYWNELRKSWSVGVTRRLGRGAPARPQVPTQDGGGVVIEVSASDAPGTDLVVAGDFSNWQPVPMRREGDTWTIHLPLAPGIYHYAFRTGSGHWFVPESASGRRSDGMGGFVALLVVS